MTPTDKCYAVMEMEAIGMSVDAKEHANPEVIGAHLRKFTEALGDLQAEIFDNRIQGAGQQ